MGNLIDDLLKGIDDEATLTSEETDVPALAHLMKNYKDYKTKYDATLPEINDNSTGKELKQALAMLPSTTLLRFLNTYSDELQGIPEAVVTTTPVTPAAPIEEHPEDDKWEGPTKLMVNSLIVWIGLLFMIVILTLLYLTFNGRLEGGHEIFGSLFSTLVELIKIIVGT